MNRHILEGNCGIVDFAVLHFGERSLIYDSNECVNDDKANASVKDNLQVFDVILGADIGYDPSLHAPITETIMTLLLQNTSSSFDTALSRSRIALLAEEVRWKDVHNWYMETLISDNSGGDAISHTTALLNCPEIQEVPALTKSTNNDEEKLRSNDMKVQEKHKKNPIHLLTLQSSLP